MDKSLHHTMNPVGIGLILILIRGFDPIEDAVRYGRDLPPRVRELVAEPDARRLHAAAAEEDDP